MRRLEGKIGLVTGGAMGLGKAIARRLGAEGAKVIITDVQEQAGRAAAAELGATFLEQDVCDEAAWPQVIAEVEKRFGALHILVNNAGILGSIQSCDPETTPFADWKRVFSVNVDSVFLGCRAAIPAMRRARQGAIINISSVAGLLATPYATAYGATKATVAQLTQSVAQHCAEQRLNIRCNSVHPGNVWTPLWERKVLDEASARGLTADTIRAEAVAEIPMGDWTRPEDIAAGVAYLASDDARHVTGTKLIIDGGYIGCDTYQRATK